MNEEQPTKELIESRLKELPPVIRDAITNSDWLKTIRRIVKKNNLLIDQGLAVETETFLLMVGATHPKDYTKNIRAEAGLTTDQAINIATEVNETILKDIKQRIIKLSQKELGIKESPLDEVLGYNKRMEDALPSIDLNLKRGEHELNRDNLIDELKGDLEISDGFNTKEENQLMIPPKETVVENNFSKTENQVKPRSNIIETSGEDWKNSRTIETGFKYNVDNLPNLNPIRTLETDVEKTNHNAPQKQNVLPPQKGVEYREDAVSKEADIDVPKVINPQKEVGAENSTSNQVEKIEPQKNNQMVSEPKPIIKPETKYQADPYREMLE